MAQNELKVILTADVKNLQANSKAAIAAVGEVTNAVKGIPRSFDVAGAAKDAMERISASVDKAAAAALNGSEAFETMGRAPLKDLKVLDAELKSIKSTLASGFKPAIDNIKLTGANFSTLSSQAGSAGVALRSVRPGANEASFALMNVGRVAQDVPFGFMGIQNNLNPLLESFQRLKAQTGSTGLALKALGSSLVGAGGVGLALSVVSSAILIFQNGIMGFNRKTKEATDKSKEFAETLKTTGEVARSGASSVAGQIATVRLLSDAILDTNNAYSQRKNALEQLKNINKAHFGDLKLESSSLATLTARVQEYSQALIQEAVVKKYADEIARVTVEYAEQNNKLLENDAAVTRARKSLEAYYASARRNKKALTTAGGASPELDEELRLIGNLNKAETAFKKQRDIVEGLATNMALMNGSMRDAIDLQLQLKPLDEAKTKKSVDQLKEMISNLEDLKKVAGLLKSEEALLMELKISLAIRDAKIDGLNQDQLQRKIEAIINEGTQKMKAFTVKIAIDPQLKQGLDVGNAVGKIEPGFNNSSLQAIQASAEAARERIKGLTVDVAQVTRLVGNSLNSAFVDLFENLITGSRRAFQSITNFLRNLLIQLAATIAKAAVLAAIFSALGMAGPDGAKGFSALFKQFSGLKLGTGGIATSPTFAMIGESGPEAVIPINQLNSLMSGSMQEIYVRGEISGDVIKLIMDREMSRFGRGA